jgi:hypothetical protein
MKALTGIAAGVLALVLALLATAELMLFAPLRATDLEIEALRRNLEAIDNRLSSASAALADTAGTLPSGIARIGGDPSIVESDFQEQVRGQLTMVDAMTLTSQVVPTDILGDYRKVSLLLHAQLAEASLLAFLEQVRQARPLVIVETLDMSPLPYSTDARNLDVSATLTMFHTDAAS